MKFPNIAELCYSAPMRQKPDSSDTRETPDGFVTYAVFTRPSAIIPGGGVHLQQCDSRDIATLNIPSNAFEFYFCDAPPANHPTLGRDPLGHETNLSTMIFVAREVISRDELQARLLAKGVIKSLDPIKAERDKDGKLKDFVVKHGVWLAKSKCAPWHAIGAGGEIMPVHTGHGIMVIDHDKNILMDVDADMPRALKKPEAPIVRITPPRPRDARRYKL